MRSAAKSAPLPGSLVRKNKNNKAYQNSYPEFWINECKKKHPVKIDWTGVGMPRIYYPLCKRAVSKMYMADEVSTGTGIWHDRGTLDYQTEVKFGGN